MDPTRRRTLLQRLGLLGTIGLAGCQESTDGSTSQPAGTDAKPTQSSTSQESTTGDESVSIDVSVTQNGTEQTPTIRVTGTVSAATGIDTVRISAGETDVTRQPDGATRVKLDDKLAVDGGSRYTVEISVTTIDGATHTDTVSTDYIPVQADGISVDRLVGAHYYPWFEMHSGHENWTDRVVADPVLDEYASDNPTVVDQHLAWCLEHGIRWLSISWWGKDSGSDDAIRSTVLPAEKFDQFQFSILYETDGRLGEFDHDLSNPAAKSRLREDLQYLEETYFSQENYLRIDDRPVVFFYIAGALTGDVAEAFREVMADLETPLYVLADLPFGSPPSTYPIAPVTDAVTAYNPYSARPDIESVFHDIYEQGSKVMELGAEAIDLDYVPVVIPGFNDTEIPDSQREDNPILEASPERYRRVCTQVSPHLADSTAVLVTSFNEWYENTQIEPSESYGTRYLELTREHLATGHSDGYDPEGYTLRLEFDTTVVPSATNPDSTDDRELAFMAGGLDLLVGDQPLQRYDIGTPAEEPLFLEGAFAPVSNPDRSWRWLGGRTAETTVFLEVAERPDRAILYGQPMTSNGISANVFFEGSRTDQVAFGDRTGSFDPYQITLQ